MRLPWQGIGACLRVATHTKALANPYTTSEVVEIVHSWFSGPAIGRIEPGERYWEIRSRLSVDSPVRGALVAGAALAALAMEVGATVATWDRDLRRFDGLKLLDPVSEG